MTVPPSGSGPLRGHQQLRDGMFWCTGPVREHWGQTDLGLNPDPLFTSRTLSNDVTLPILGSLICKVGIRLEVRMVLL